MLILRRDIHEMIWHPQAMLSHNFKTKIDFYDYIIPPNSDTPTSRILNLTPSFLPSKRVTSNVIQLQPSSMYTQNNPKQCKREHLIISQKFSFPPNERLRYWRSLTYGTIGFHIVDKGNICIILKLLKIKWVRWHS